MTIPAIRIATFSVMKTSPLVFGLVPFALLALLPAGCSKLPAATPSVPSAAQPSVTDIAASYKTYKKITPAPVFVNPELAMLCRGANEKDVAAARTTKGPHANTAVLIYMNDSAAKAFAGGGNSYLPGSVIVKQKTDLGYVDSQSRGPTRRAIDGVGGMVKRAPGFDPEHGDWEYFYFEDAAKIETGRIVSCVECHKGAKNTDYVFGTWAERKKR